VKFGIILSNREVLTGSITIKELLAVADAVEASPLLESVWAGDSLLVNQRLSALPLLAAVAARTERILLGTACMASFSLRDPRVLAHEWASLDRLSGGRTRLVVCSGAVAGAAWEAESAAMGFDPKERRRRMVENIEAVRHLWTHDAAPFEGRFLKFAGISLEPKPVQSPCPIWLATNPSRHKDGRPDAGATPIAIGRAGRHADGWMTHSVGPDGFRRAWEAILDTARSHGRDTAGFDNVLYQHLTIATDRASALDEAAAYLVRHGSPSPNRQQLEARLIGGAPRECAAQIRQFVDTGCRRIIFRIASRDDPAIQLRRLVEEVLPEYLQ
jgi:alkanesulfonate monooxygenase SsuD/methylene tetrahydromethanopterin reductase-like flavin-dependent oxidoreductase (luciferase family)